MKNIQRRRLGPTSEKILLLLETGAILGLTRRPDCYFSVLRQAKKQWKEIEERKLRDTIKRLYHSKLIDYKENKDKTVTMRISEEGRQKLLRYHLEKMTIQNQAQWDGLWRMVLFDVPERMKAGRDAIARKLRELRFYPLQKSAFVFPYECKDEIDFIIEMFNLRPYVRFLMIKDIDVAPDLKKKFNVR